MEDGTRLLLRLLSLTGRIACERGVWANSWTMTLAAPERRKRKGYPAQISTIQSSSFRRLRSGTRRTTSKGVSTHTVASLVVRPTTKFQALRFDEFVDSRDQRYGS